MKTAMSGSAAGTVISIAGEVRAAAPDGTGRILQLGDRVFAQELISTTANAVVQIHFENGRLFDLAPDSTVVLDDIVSGNASPVALASPHGVGELLSLSAPDPDSAEFAAAHSAVPQVSSENAAEHRGAENVTVVVEQANAYVQVTAGFAAEPLSHRSVSEAGQNSPSEEASFLVPDTMLFRHPAMAVSDAPVSDGRLEERVADGAGTSTDTANMVEEGGSPWHAGTDANNTEAGASVALEDLLHDLPHADDLAAYMSFSYDASAKSTTVNVHPAIGSGGDHKIVLAGVDLTAGGTLPAEAIIQNLLASGKLHTDA
jgi:hypothetical protein